MAEFIIENWEVFLLASTLPFIIVYPWAQYRIKKADEELVKSLVKITDDMRRK